MQQPTTQSSRASQFFRASVTSLIFGMGALCLPASQAFALQVSVADTQNVFTVMEQSGPLNG
ncbi:MAG: hypothetical protein O3A59_06450, partial [Nitrospirae bacterium]|nr:hypothetical protein [Nitrospirota bacterium]